MLQMTEEGFLSVITCSHASLHIIYRAMQSSLRSHACIYRYSILFKEHPNYNDDDKLHDGAFVFVNVNFYNNQ